MQQEPQRKNIGPEHSQFQHQLQKNPIILLNNPIRYVANFQNSTSLCAHLIHQHEYEKGIEQINRTLDLMDLGRDVLKPVSPYWKLCLYGNLAMCYQRLWQIGKANKCCIKIERELQHLLNCENKLEIRFSFLKKMIKLKFQRCAILSQINDHQEALTLCKDTFKLLETYLQGLATFIKGIEKPAPSDTKNPDNIFFIGQVINFAEEAIDKLLKTLKQPIQTQSQTDSQFYFWSRNPGKNQEQIRRFFYNNKEPEECKRSILGVNKNKMEISDFNIGSIMHIEEYHINQFKKFAPLEEYLFKQKIHELIVYCSMAFFTLATELRFIQSLAQSNNSLKNTICKKYGYEEKTDAYKLSELYHLQSIYIVAKNINTKIPYLTHIIRSYQKHYIMNKPLPIIHSIAEESMASIATCKGQKSTEQNLHFQDDENQEYQFNKIHDKAIQTKKLKDQSQNTQIRHKPIRSLNKVPDNSGYDLTVTKEKNNGVDLKPILIQNSIKKYENSQQLDPLGEATKKKKNNSVGKRSTKSRKIVRKFGGGAPRFDTEAPKKEVKSEQTKKKTEWSSNKTKKYRKKQ